MDDKNLSMGDSLEQGAKNAIKMGQDTARAAKTVSKAAGQAAAGDVAGAAVSLLKDETTRKIIVVAVLVSILLPVLFLYALPTAIFETVGSFFSEMVEEWKAGVYEGGTDVIWGAIVQTIKTGASLIADAAKSVWNTVKGIFTSSGDDAGSEYDKMSDTGMELRITQTEDDEKTVLTNKIEAVMAKVDARIEDVKDAIDNDNVKNAIYNSLYSTYGHNYDEFYVQTTVSSSSMSKNTAIKLLSLYTVQEGASLENVKTSALMQWLGWYNRLDSGTTKFKLGNFGVTGAVKTWKGTFLPQYLMDQRTQEIEMYGSTVTDFSKMSCAAADLIIQIDCPDKDEVTIIRTEEIRYAGPFAYTVIVGRAYVNISVGVDSDLDLLTEITGLTEGALQSKSGMTIDEFLDWMKNGWGSNTRLNLFGGAGA